MTTEGSGRTLRSAASAFDLDVEDARSASPAPQTIPVFDDEGPKESPRFGCCFVLLGRFVVGAMLIWSLVVMTDQELYVAGAAVLLLLLLAAVDYMFDAEEREHEKRTGSQPYMGRGSPGWCCCAPLRGLLIVGSGRLCCGSGSGAGAAGPGGVALARSTSGKGVTKREQEQVVNLVVDGHSPPRP